MNTSPFRAIYRVLFALTMLSLAQPSFAQQAAPAAPQTPVSSQPPAVAARAPAPTAAIQPAPAADAAVTSIDSGRSLKSTTVALRELSLWSMFLSADILVKAVMIGLAFASLVTWTIFIAKMIELSLIRRKLRAALGKISDSRSLSEAQSALGAKDSVLSALLAAAMREARLSAGISSDGGIKERAASSFAEIVRAEARRIRLGMGLLATIGATSPFVGLFGTVWGIMNSFIGISKSQTTNLAVVAPGIAEALLATAFGLVAAIPAVIIYNHFSRVTKGYLELVGRSSGAAGRLLSRDLDRTHASSPAARMRERRSNMKRIRLTLALLAAFIFADCFHGVRSFAQTTEDWALCLRGDLSTPDRPIEGCTAVINTGRQVLRRLATAYNNRGVAYRIKGNYGPAIDDFNEALRLVPDYASAFNNRGVAYRNMGDLARAVDDYDQAIRIKPDYVAAYYNRGLALTGKGEYGKAISDFTVVLRVDPKNPIVIYRRGEAYLKSGEIDAGNADLAQATAIKPDIAAAISRGGP